MEEHLTEETDMETGNPKTTNKQKISLGLIISLLLAIFTSFVFMSVFINYQRKYVNARKFLEQIKFEVENALTMQKDTAATLLKVKGLAIEMTNTDTSSAPLSEPVLMKRKMIGCENLGNIEEQKNDFKIMQFNILADGLCGLYDPSNPDVQHFEKAMEPANQHYLYWRYRFPLIVAEIIDNDADIVTIQENDHPKAIQEALNIRAEGKNIKASWICIHKPKSKSPIQTVRELPSKNNKTDGSSICWNSEKFTQNGDFGIKQESYPVYKQNFYDNSQTEVADGDVYVAVKLTKKDTEKDVIVVTTRFESLHLLGGEEIRKHQMKHLMKDMSQWKKDNNNIPIIFTGDLNAIPEKNMDGFKKPKADTILEMKDLNGTYYCQMGTPNIISAIVIHNTEFKIVKNWVININAQHHVDSIPHGSFKIHENNDFDLFEMYINNELYIFNKKQKFHIWNDFQGSEIKCQRRFDDNLENPISIVAEKFNLANNIFGQTFYDSYNQKYVIADFDDDEPINGDYQITIGSKDHIMNYDSNLQIFKINTGAVKCTLVLAMGSYTWGCSSNKTMVWSKKQFNLLQVDYPATVYNYITKPEKIFDSVAIKTLKDDIISNLSTNGYISLDNAYNQDYENFIEHAIDNLVQFTPQEKQQSIDLDFKSSQKVLNIHKQEPDCTLLKKSQQTFPIITGPSKITKATVGFFCGLKFSFVSIRSEFSWNEPDRSA
jgi:hypothetical protein